MLKIEHLTKKYGEKVAVNDLYEVLTESLHKSAERLLARADVGHYLRHFYSVGSCRGTGIEQYVSFDIHNRPPKDFIKQMIINNQLIL